ncbi:hypothetical protein BpHYR1_005175 [Brachionus plicatilis]|uniref:Uncharacterized protein n=1 Tax=Brachionus plicatilis TaxID=10195 RepID=A0A3M7RPQ9_BRAPC|nr:hypothetical protein BpHYR1_005175 [Brachionus plicatilis]
MLMFGRSNTSGLPSMVKQLDNSDLHAKAVENDNRAKSKMKEHFDNMLKTRQPQIRVGSKSNPKSDQVVEPRRSTRIQEQRSKKEGGRCDVQTSLWVLYLDCGIGLVVCVL